MRLWLGASTRRRGWRPALIATAVAVLAACRSPLGADLSVLAGRPALPCSVLVTGGAFVEMSRANANDGPRARTFGSGADEAFALSAIGDLLGRARVFVRTATDQRPSAERQGLATASAVQDEAGGLDEVLRQARVDGHDYLLVLERLDDGPVEALGVNGQWPITLTTWLLVGLGALIPDHAYESRASLRATLRDVHDGQAVQELVIGAGSVELSLLERTGAWGWIESILVPPFWVGDDDERVLDMVRPVVQQRLMVGLAQRLKSVDVADRLARRQPAVPALHRRGDGLELEVVARESLSFLRLRVDDYVLAGADFEAFHRALLASRTADGDRLRYRAFLGTVPGGHRLQVLMQTITGRAGSVSFDLHTLP